MKFKNTTISIVNDDITELSIDGIVNAANGQLTMEEGLAGIIKKKGGQIIEDEALSKGPIAMGEAISTSAGQLKSNYVIHAVTVDHNSQAEQETIRSAFANALKCAEELKLQSLAVPALGCGAGNFPLTGAAKIMTQEMMRYTKMNPETSLKQITFCLYDREEFDEFEKSMRGYIVHLQETLGPGPYVTVDIIIEVNEGIILIERSNPPYGWALPGGFLDYGESLERAAIREAKEETNLDLVNLRQFHSYSQPNRDPRFHTISTVFIAKGKGEPKSGDDAKDLKIVRFEDLPQLDYAFDHKDIIKEYLMEREFGDDHF